MTIAKGLTSAYAPLSGSIVSDRVWKVLEQGTDEFGPIGHGWTYSAHPIGAAAGVANLKLIDSLGLVENAGSDRRLSEEGDDRCASAIIRMSERSVARGCSAPSSSSADKTDRIFFDPSLKVGARITAALLEQGVIGRAMPQGDILGLAPPLCLTREEADRIVAATATAVGQVAAEV
ncbi:MAG: aminotransferase class III-fold pyridoxal phosphate-dependent enzyme [Thalassobaculum sp.]